MKPLRMQDWLNLPRALCRYLLGHDHGTHHRMFAGVAMMATGVLIAKTGGEIHAFQIHYVADVVGYGLHGLGLIPFIEMLGLEEKA